MITIGNKRNGARGHYIGRPSALGNPFVIGRDGDRNNVIRLYSRWLANELHRHPSGSAALEFNALLQQHKAGKDLTLVCWCAPLPCHGDVIKHALEQE